MLKKSFVLSLMVVMAFGFAVLHVGVKKASAEQAWVPPGCDDGDDSSDCDTLYGPPDDGMDDISLAPSADQARLRCSIAGGTSSMSLTNLADLTSGYEKMTCSNMNLTGPSGTSAAQGLNNIGAKWSGYGINATASVMCTFMQN